MSVIALISTRLLVREAPKSTDRQLLARAPDTAWVIPSAGLAVPVKAWNVPGHMLGATAYQVLRQECPQSIEKVKAVLEKYPWYAT